MTKSKKPSAKAKAKPAATTAATTTNDRMMWAAATELTAYPERVSVMFDALLARLRGRLDAVAAVADRCRGGRIPEDKRTLAAFTHLADADEQLGLALEAAE